MAGRISPLPEEILDQVCDALGQEARRAADKRASILALCNISLASRTLHRIVQPALFHSVDLYNLTSDRRRKLLLCFINSPEMTRLVRYLKVPPRQAHHHLLSPQPTSPTEEVTGRFTEAASRLDVSANLRTRFRKAFAMGDGPAEIAMVLCLSQNIARLDLEVTSHLQQTLSMGVLSDAVSRTSRALNQNHFRALEEVRVKPQLDLKQITEIFHTSAILKLPRLRTFYGFGMRHKEDSPKHLPPSFQSPVRKLVLTASYLDSFGLDRLLSVCPDVTTLVLQWRSLHSRDYYEPFENYAFAPEAFGKVLRQRGTTLRSLVLTPSSPPLVRQQSQWLGEEDTDTFDYLSTTLGSLTELAMLQELTVQATALFGRYGTWFDLIKTLPSSLQTLRVTENDPENLASERPGLRAFLESQQLGQLVSVKLYYYEAPLQEDFTGSQWIIEADEPSCWAMSRRVPADT